MKKLAIFASGSGTNFQRICDYFQPHPQVEVCLLVCNNPKAGVIQRAEKLRVPVILIDKERFYQLDDVSKQLDAAGINLIVLAGFLWLIPVHLLKAFPNKIINIHPALLPKFGGKGMFGENVHKAVLAAGEKESGITIHFVNENYDDGAILFQQKISLNPNETPESLATRIHELEYLFFPEVINKLVEG